MAGPQILNRQGENMKIHCTRYVMLAAALVYMSGCAPIVSSAMNVSVDEQEVRTKTAKYFGAPEDEIEITNYDKQLLATGYQTTYQGELFNCRVYYGSVDCARPGDSW